MYQSRPVKIKPRSPSYPSGLETNRTGHRRTGSAGSLNFCQFSQIRRIGHRRTGSAGSPSYHSGLTFRIASKEFCLISCNHDYGLSLRAARSSVYPVYLRRVLSFMLMSRARSRISSSCGIFRCSIRIRPSQITVSIQAESAA